VIGRAIARCRARLAEAACAAASAKPLRGPVARACCLVAAARPRRVACALATAIGLVASAGAAAQQSSGCDDLSGRPIHFGVDWQAEVKPIINELTSPDGRCTSCHNAGDAAGGLDLSDTGGDAIYKIVDSYYVQPGAPRSSLLFLKVNCAQPPSGARMPPTGSPLSLQQQELIHDWIAQGALGEPAQDPIFRAFVFRDGAESQR
jgi:hypothetical protein